MESYGLLWAMARMQSTTSLPPNRPGDRQLPPWQSLLATCAAVLTHKVDAATIRRRWR